MSYEIADAGRGVALCVELAGTRRPPISPMPAVRIEPILHRGRRMARLTTTETNLVREFHDLLLAVADRVVGDGLSFNRAFDETVHAWSALLGRSRGLSLERRLGLQGELAVLGRLAGKHGWGSALDAWVGPQGEEHDFALSEADLEIKTTASEARRHTVHGIGQLTETVGRPLWFASLRLTRGGEAGRTLRESATAARDAAAAENIACGRRLDTHLASCGYDPEQPDDERWTPRDSPLVMRTTTMPRLSEDDLLVHDGRITRVTYVVDVTGLPASDEPPVDLSDLSLL
ncbi:PD-(D/E)XK motif protein [Streptomyces sp. NPDC005227]|uniref:PD-(D/E)XK motif protein n=1 Tax=Streptomyces sp. NPDC005227 TaxID=3364707 RepID=UPI00367EC61B